jgi:hypothetical protein
MSLPTAVGAYVGVQALACLNNSISDANRAQGSGSQEGLVSTKFRHRTKVTQHGMKGFLLSVLVANSLHAQASMLPVIERGGEAHVSAARLEREAGIAVKRLPGKEQFVACSGERCALIKDCVADKGDLLVRVESLAKALDAKIQFDETRRKVGLDFSAGSSAVAGTTSAGVGQLAPDLWLTKLDGTSVALSDFRGKRVLINSWASW